MRAASIRIASVSPPRETPSFSAPVVLIRSEFSVEVNPSFESKDSADELI